MRAWLLLLGAAACGGDGKVKPDAFVAPPTLTLYLNFDGVTVTPGMDDAATNISSIVSAQTTVPAYLSGVATRDTTIASIVSETKTRFSPFDVAVVTDRPASLAYFMIVYTGTPNVIFPGQGAGLTAVTTQPCTQASAASPDVNGIAYQFQSAASADMYTPVERANLSIPLVALAENVSPTSKNGDCLCFAATGCGLPTAACTIGGAGTPVDTAHACTGAPASIDEMASLVTILGTAH